MTQAVVFAADSIAKSFGPREVLRSVSISVQCGEIHAIVGRNGAGASTFLRISAGLVRADRGHIEVGGIRLDRPRQHRLAAAGVFFLPARGLFSPALSLQQHMDAVTAQFGDQHRDATLDALRVREFQGRKSTTLSGGERRRAELALARVRDPQTLLADEPFLGIMPIDRALVRDALRALAERGCGIVVTGHEARDLFDLADVIQWLTHGTLQRLGTPDEALRHPAFRSEYAVSW